MFSRFNIQTRLSPLEAEEVLRSLVRPRDRFLEPRPLPQNIRPFVGTVERGAFKCQRFIVNRNSFLPIVIGRVIPAEGGALVRGHMRMAVSVSLFMTIWLGGTISLAVSSMRDGNVYFGIGFSCLPLYGALLVGLGYYPERREALRLLTEALQLD